MDEGRINKIKLKLSKTEHEAACIEYILSYINSFSNNENKERVSLNILNLLSDIYERDLGNLNTFNILIFHLSEIIKENYNLHLLNFYVIYSLMLYNKNKWRESIDLLPLFEIKKIISNKHLTAYLDLTKKTAVSLIKERNYKFELVSIIYSNFLFIIETLAYKNDPEKCFYILNLLGGQYNYCEKLIALNTKYGNEFIKNLCDAFNSICKENENWCLNNMNELFIMITKYAIMFLSFEIKNSLPIENSLRLINDFVFKLENNKIIFLECSKIIIDLLKLFVLKNKKMFENLIIKFDDSFQTLIMNNDCYEMCIMDTAITISHIIKINIEHISNNLSEKVIEKLINIYNNLKKILDKLVSNKLNCSKCNNIKHHEIDVLTESMLIFFRKLIDNNLLTKKFIKNLYEMIEYKLKIIYELKCPFQQHINKNCLINIYNILKKIVHSPILDNYILNIIKLLYKYRILFNMIEINEKSVIKLFSHFYTNINDKLNLLHSQFWYILILMKDESLTHGDIINEFSCTVKTYQTSPELCSMHVIDVLKTKTEYLPKYNEIDLLFLQLESVETFWSNPHLKLTIGKCLIDQLDDPIKQGEMLYWLEDSSSQFFEDTLKNVYESLKKIEAKDAKIYAILGLVSFRLYMLDFNTIKEQNKNELFSAETIIDNPIIGWTIHEENIIVNYLNNSLKYYTKYIEKNKDRLKSCFMATSTIRILNIIANHYMLRNFHVQATKAWLLTYLLAKYNDEKFGVINSVSYFAEQNKKDCIIDALEFLQDEFINIDDIINNCCITLEEELKTIEKLSRSKQNHIFLCMMNISLYYANMHQYDKTKFYLNIINRNLQKWRPNEALDIVKVKYYGTILIIITKYKCFNINLSPLIYSKKMLTQIREIKYLTSYDSILIPIILFNLILEIGNLSINRYDINGFEPYIFMLLKFAYKLGLSKRGAEILITLSIMDLTTERMKFFLGNITQINLLLKVDTINDLITIKKHLKCSKDHTNSSQTSLIEPARHEIAPNNNNSPISINMEAHKITPSREILDKYLITHKDRCDCSFCIDKQLKLYLFQTACIVARLFFINKDYLKCLDVSTKLYKHWQHMQKIYRNMDTLNNEFYQFSARMLLYYGHILRKNDYFDRAISAYEESYKTLIILNGHDFALEQDIIHNISSLKFIMNHQSPKTTIRISRKQIAPIKLFFDEDKVSPKTPLPTPDLGVNKIVATSKKKKLKKADSENNENEIMANIDQANLDDKNCTTGTKKGARIKKQIAPSPNISNILVTKRTLRSKKQL